MRTDRNVRTETTEMQVRPSFALRLKPILVALGVVPSSDPLPELAQWRRRRVSAA